MHPDHPQGDLGQQMFFVRKRSVNAAAATCCFFVRKRSANAAAAT
ncbi:hypothetical protein QUF87_01005 [Lysinibacillus pakistanensis]|nr:hypothetical protein [Lysinibacillus pakistanensis]